MTQTTKTRVVNIKKENNIQNNEMFVYIGRPSIFGNPFKIGKDGTRKEVIEKYKGYFRFKLGTDQEFKSRVCVLKGKVLGCYCKPLACHGDVIVKYLERRNSE